MEYLEKQMSPELVERLKTDKTAADAVRNWIETLQAHHNNPVYTRAAAMTEKTRRQQIDKGAEKYPEPLNPQSWTIPELVDHGMMELVDQTHYIAGIAMKAEGMAKEVGRAVAMIEEADTETNEGLNQISRALDVLRGVMRQL